LISNPASVADLAARVNKRIADLAQTLLGDPNPGHSTKCQLRYGTKGSVAIEIAGPRAGQWHDFEAGIGGAGLELICHHLGLDEKAAWDWARNWLGDIPHRPTKPSAPAPDNKDRKAIVAGIIARSEGPGEGREANQQSRRWLVGACSCTHARFGTTDLVRGCRERPFHLAGHRAGDLGLSRYLQYRAGTRALWLPRRDRRRR